MRLNEHLLRPLLGSDRTFYIVAGILLIPIAWFVYAWVFQLTKGLGVTALRTPVGAAMGVYITTFVFFVGIAHGGIALAAGIRLLKLTSLRPIARIGEVLTIVSVAMAGLSIILDMGRPDRVFHMIQYWPQRVGWSPLTWDITVIFTYFALSLTYLWLTMRKDLFLLSSRVQRRQRIYKALLIGYQPGEEQEVERLAWWLSLAVVFLVVMLSGGVVPWLFGLISSRPGWFSALAGPYFLTAAITSAIAVVVVIAAVLRRVFNWQAYIQPQIFRGLGTLIGLLTIFYLYLTLAEQLTFRYASPLAEMTISDMLLRGEFAPIYLPMIVVGLLIPALWLFVQAIRPAMFSVAGTTLASAIILVAFWVKRFFIIVPSFLRPYLPFPTGNYSPSWVEWSLVIGVFAIAILLYMLFMKLFPIMEVGEQ